MARTIKRMTTSQIITDTVLGHDIVAVARIHRFFERFGERGLKRLFSQDEIMASYRGKNAVDRAFDAAVVQRLAGRFAVKEAVAKALGVGFKGLGCQRNPATSSPVTSSKSAFKRASWLEITLHSDGQSAPSIKLTGNAAAVAREKNISQWRVSHAHDGDMASATVLGLVFLQEKA
ncbi:MAG: holo-ACP synthase [Cyanobacteria bacterium]|nr:holo-ACP synthase [Cyanobacteriota bacterium]